jgi:hypothetical protein
LNRFSEAVNEDVGLDSVESTSSRGCTLAATRNPQPLAHGHGKEVPWILTGLCFPWVFVITGRVSVARGAHILYRGRVRTPTADW